MGIGFVWQIWLLLAGTLAIIEMTVGSYMYIKFIVYIIYVHKHKLASSCSLV